MTQVARLKKNRKSPPKLIINPCRKHQKPTKFGLGLIFISDNHEHNWKRAIKRKNDYLKLSAPTKANI